MRRSRRLLLLVAAWLGAVSASVACAAAGGWPVDCSDSRAACADVADSDDTFGHYVGHDEPSLAFYSNVPNSGSHVRWRVTLPSEPSALPPTGVRTFEIALTFWFGMALCDTQSHPLQVATCAPASDGNITDLAHHPGTAFMELQFYPPGWVRQPFGMSCDDTHWCAALAIFSLARNPVTGQTLNARCAKHLHGGVESTNFAFVTKDGRPHAPPDPLNGRASTSGTVDPSADLLMDAGDTVLVAIEDTPSGVQVRLDDLTTQESGSMTASAANGFAQVVFAPKPSRDCRVVPYDFHAMYSTSSEETRAPWTANAINVSFAAEIGHFQLCSRVNPRTHRCVGEEGAGHADRDDKGCVPSPPAPLLAGCIDQNTGFDGPSYQHDWPNGDTTTRPTPFVVQSPLGGEGLSDGYERIAFETNLPILEALHGKKKLTRTSRKFCDILSGGNCSLLPSTDRHEPAALYPFFSLGGDCAWAIGDADPAFAMNDFGGNTQYGHPILVPHLFKNGRVVNEALFFRGTIDAPCTPVP
ncbi:MAG TPA: hypothetical protein VKU61_08750 [Candidatus Binatia bacterium]|nr:hypothetical protein [Candidatus Binatia bacterium]